MSDTATPINENLKEAFDKMSIPLPGSDIRVMTYTGFALITEQIVSLSYQKGKEEALQYLENMIAQKFGN